MTDLLQSIAITLLAVSMIFLGLGLRNVTRAINLLIEHLRRDR